MLSTSIAPRRGTTGNQDDRRLLVSLSLVIFLTAGSLAISPFFDRVKAQSIQCPTGCRGPVRISLPAALRTYKSRDYSPVPEALRPYHLAVLDSSALAGISGAGGMVGLGLLLGAAGGLGGWIIGSRAFDSGEAGLAVAALGESVLLPLGVRLASEYDAGFGKPAAIAVGIAAIGYAFVLGEYTDAAIVAAAVVVPLVQLPIVIGLQASPYSNR